MNIMLVSQCSKQALPATRRILDQFAERKGDRTWLTPITQVGLQTLYQLLRKQARRNTAVACHWVKGGEIELLWVVGNRRKFNSHGTVPTNYTGRDILGKQREDGWRHTESIALLAALAGLFHDFGKANALFQAKLKGTRKAKAEPIRHEWLSVRLFEAFVANQSDAQWLAALASLGVIGSEELVSKVYQDKGTGGRRERKHVLLQKLEDRPIAWAVGWLILCHHRLPFPYVDKRKEVSPCHAGNTTDWPDLLRPAWNSPQATVEHPSEEWEKLWRFADGLPCASVSWQKQAQSLSRRALRHNNFFNEDWPKNTFALHLSRCALMLADHYYSGHDKTPHWQDKKYAVFANTLFAEDANKRPLNQQLDEHCVGVSHHSYLIAKSLPLLPDLLPAVGDVRALRKPAKKPFQWQNKAYSLAVQLRDSSQLQGGFFVNMASTGTGKTLANARIAYGLSDERRGCRFSVLLGLRTLTLQTGTALRERTGLSDVDLAVLVGSSAVRELYERSTDDKQTRSSAEQCGSASAEALFGAEEYILYDGALEKTRVGKWLQQKSAQKGGATLNTLLSAPVLVSTIDRLMPASESGRGGHQVAPMLRLLSADTVFDEPDDFGLADLPALTRLVYFSGLMGGRVVFSSATLPPSLMEALYGAYAAGRGEFNRATLGETPPIPCGWIDENGTQSQTVADTAQFAQAQQLFVAKRLQRLSQLAAKQCAEIIPVVKAEESALADRVIANTAATVAAQMTRLHEAHHNVSLDGNTRVSVGLMRMANIDPLVAVAQQLAQSPPPDGYQLHLCVYHSHHPLYRRATIERHLDELLDRHAPAALWRLPAVAHMEQSPECDHIVLVLATAVAEVGRDHDYDWAIVEPSSMRSIVQLAGRVRRHRGPPSSEQPNIALLEKNIRAQRGQSESFIKPGFESKNATLHSHSLSELMLPEHYQQPSSASRINEASPLQPNQLLVDLEHHATRKILFDTEQGMAADLWWREPVRWCFELQSRTPFRAGSPQDSFALVAKDLAGEVVFYQYSEGDWFPQDGVFHRSQVEFAPRVSAWPLLSDEDMLAELDQQHDNLEIACKRFASLSLDRSATPQWHYHPWLGVYRSPN